MNKVLRTQKIKSRQRLPVLNLKVGFWKSYGIRKRYAQSLRLSLTLTKKKLKGKKKSSQPATAEKPSDDDCDNCEEDMREDDLPMEEAITVIPEEGNDEPDVVPMSHLE
jgi:hypothetical protein